MARLTKRDLLLCRFFRGVRLQRPKLFYFFLSCCALQLLVTVLKLEVTPFFLYGMYSEKQQVPDTATLKTVYLDSVPLQAVPLPYRQRDLLLTGIDNYLAQKANGGMDVVQARVEQRYPFLTTSPLYPAIRNHIYNTRADLFRFESWFKQKCSRLINRPVNKVTVVETRYTVDQATLSVKRIAHEPVASF